MPGSSADVDDTAFGTTALPEIFHRVVGLSPSPSPTIG
jgi:hypothetical protein